MKTHLLQTTLSAALVLPFLLSCSGKSIPADGITANPDLHIVDVSHKEKEIRLSDFFKGAKTIILESPDEAVIGNIDGMQTTDDYIFVLDQEHAMGVFLFDKTGRFIRRIGQIGQGPGEYIEVSDFTLDPEKEEIYLMDPESGRINKYNYETGKFLHAIPIENEDMNVNNIQFEQGRLYTDAFFYGRKRENTYMLQEIDPATGELRHKWLDIGVYNKGWYEYATKPESFFFSRNGGSAKYITMVMDSVLFFDGDQIKPYLLVKEPDWVTATDIKRLQENNRNKPAANFIFPLLDQEEIAYNISNYVEFKEWIYFNYAKHGKTQHIFYNTATKETRINDRIFNDLVYPGNSGLLLSVSCADANGIYESVQAFNMPDLIASAQEGHLHPGLERTEEIKKLTLDSNPVIFYYENK